MIFDGKNDIILTALLVGSQLPEISAKLNLPYRNYQLVPALGLLVGAQYKCLSYSLQFTSSMKE